MVSKNKTKNSEVEVPDVSITKVRQGTPVSPKLEITLPDEFVKKHGIQKGDVVKLMANDICIIAPVDKEIAMRKLKVALLRELQEGDEKEVK